MGSLFDKGGGNTTVTQDNEPPKWAQPLFKQSANDAVDLYKSNTGFNIWPGSTVAEPSEMTRQGSQALIETARSPDSTSLAQNPVNLTNQAISQGGLMAPAQDAMGFFGDVAGGDMSPSTDPFYAAQNAVYNPASMQATNVYGQAGGGDFNTQAGDRYQFLGQRALGSHPGDRGLAQFAEGRHGVDTGVFGQLRNRALGAGGEGGGAAEDFLTSTARGDYLEEGNPYFRQILEKEADRLGDQISGQFSAAGRYGSGANQDVLGETVGDFMLQGLGQDFARERGLQMNAAQAIENAQQGRLGLAGQFAGQGAGFEAGNLNRRLGALQQQRGFAGQDIDRALQAAQGQQSADHQNAATQLHGAQGLAGQGQNLFQNLLGGAQTTFGAERANLADQMQGAQAGANLSNQGLQNALGFMGALPTVQQNRTFAPQLLQQAGAQQDQFNQAQVNDMIRRFHEQDMQPWTRLGALQAAAQGSAGAYGKTHQVTSQPSQNNFLQTAGNVARIAAPFFGMPTF